MVTLTLTDPDGREQRVHWRWDASTHDMSLRLCTEFNQNWREVRPVVLINGRPLRETERPWMELPRHATAKAEIVRRDSRVMKQTLLMKIRVDRSAGRRSASPKKNEEGRFLDRQLFHPIAIFSIFCRCFCYILAIF